MLTGKNTPGYQHPPTPKHKHKTYSKYFYHSISTNLDFSVDCWECGFFSSDDVNDGIMTILAMERSFIHALIPIYCSLDFPNGWYCFTQMSFSPVLFMIQFITWISFVGVDLWLYHIGLTLYPHTNISLTMHHFPKCWITRWQQM